MVRYLTLSLALQRHTIRSNLMVKPTLVLVFVVGPCSPSHGYFITNVFRNDGLMVAPWCISWIFSNVATKRLICYLNLYPLFSWPFTESKWSNYFLLSKTLLLIHHGPNGATLMFQLVFGSPKCRDYRLISIWWMLVFIILSMGLKNKFDTSEAYCVANLLVGDF